LRIRWSGVFGAHDLSSAVSHCSRSSVKVLLEEGRKNFTIGHELGHYSVHKDKKELRCSMADLNESDCSDGGW